jgi:hypothetical protein
MPNYAILRFKKLRGAALSCSDGHGGRTRDTPNADPERTPFNELLLGEDRELREMFEERMLEEDVWRRSNSVEVIEFMLTATRTHFEDERGELVEERIKVWERANVEWLKQEYGDLILKALSHSDERTPHITGYIIPIAEGRLNARAFVGSRSLLSEAQDEYGKAMSPLGLVRGVKGSRATHQDIGRFYATMMEPVRLEIDRERISPASRMDFLTERSREAYRDEVIKATLEQVREQVEQLYNQALLTLEQTRKREAAEERAKTKVEKAEREMREAQEALIRERAAREALEQQNELLRDALQQAYNQTKELERQVQLLGNRIVDIPLESVMRESGWKELQFSREQGYRFVHPSLGNEVRIKGSSAHDGVNDVAYNAINLVQHLHRVAGNELTPEKAAGWLVDNFGEEVARKAYLFEKEKSTHELFKAHDQGRTRQQTQRSREFEPIQRPELVPVREDHKRKRSGHSTPPR